MTTATVEARGTVALLQSVLPPVYTLDGDDDSDASYVLGHYWHARVCVDLEWDEKTGELETIGIGNPRTCTQVNWKRCSEPLREQVRAWVARVIALAPVVMHNADADIRKLRANGFAVTAESFYRLDDTMLAHAVLHSEEDHDLGYLNAELGKLPDYKYLRKVPGAESVYNAADLVATCLIWDAIDAEFVGDPQARAIYETQSLPFLWLAIEGEEAGIRVVPGVPEVLYAVHDLKRQQARNLLHAYCGWPVNINSPDQMKTLLYDIEGFAVQYDKDDKPTSGKDAISALRRSVGTEWDAADEPTLEQAWANIAAGGNVALEARYLYMGAQQAVTHYIEPCLGRDRIYPECRIHVQASGRVGYVGPALPQLKGDLLKQIGPDPGCVWVGHDWKQIEVRVLAVEANDRVYLDAFATGADIHEQNVRAVFPAKGSPELEALRRRWIKAYVFRLHYRGKPENAGDIPGTRGLFATRNTAELEERLKLASEAYLGLHPALPIFWAKVDDEADRTGMVRTFMGRPRRLTSQWAGARRREASNHKMQGAVADIFITTALLVKQAAPWARLVFGAYDSHWWQVPAARQLEFVALYAPIVEREFVINGHRIAFPADYKVRAA